MVSVDFGNEGGVFGVEGVLEEGEDLGELFLADLKVFVAIPVLEEALGV